MQLPRTMVVLQLLVLVVGMHGVAAEGHEEHEEAAPAATPVPAGETPASYYPNFDFVKVLKDAIKYELHGSPIKFLDAIIALVFGMWLVWDGKKFFKFATAGAIGVASALLAKAAFTTYWHQHWETGDATGNSMKYTTNFVGLEVFLIATAAAYAGYEGVLLSMGAGIGFIVASQLGGMMADHHINVMSKPIPMVAFYSCWVIALTAIFYKKKHEGALTIIAPMIGAAFVASALMNGATDIFKAAACKPDCPSGLSPDVGQGWVDYFLLLFTNNPISKGQDVGIFVNSSYNFAPTKDGAKWCLDRLIGVTLWVLIGAIGARSQLKRHRKLAGGTAGVAAPASTAAKKPAVKAREPLSEGLLSTDA